MLSVVLAAWPASGCGGGGNAAPATTAGASSIPACAQPKVTIPTATGLPDDFPLPPGTVLISSERPHAGQVVVRGVAPGELEAAADFFRKELVADGYDLGRSDSEAGEVESLFTGNRTRGGWRVNQIPRCPGAVRVFVVLVRQA